MLIMLTILFLLLPYFLNPYLLHIMIMTFLFAYLSRNWDLIGGYAGQLFLGPAAMFGIGGYTSSLLYVHLGLTPWLGMWVGGFMGMVVGFSCVTSVFDAASKGSILDWPPGISKYAK
jgi:branched-chain amino acid transport system permease protein